MTGISYVTETWNLTAGCTRQNAGCLNCWGQGMAARLAAKGIAGYGGVTKDSKWTGEVHLLTRNLGKPFHWKKPRRIFVCSMSDIFHQDVPDWYFRAVLGITKGARQHAYLLFTKRYERAMNILTNCMPLPHAWIIFSISNQEIADFARPYLENIAYRGWNTGVSYEPALGPIDWRGYEFIKWIVCGAESGKDRRPFEVKWAFDASLWAYINKILFYTKQASAFGPGQQGNIPDWLWNVKEPIPLPGEPPPIH